MAAGRACWRSLAVTALCAASLSLGGCVGAVAPLAASGLIAGKSLTGKGGGKLRIGKFKRQSGRADAPSALPADIAGPGGERWQVVHGANGLPSPDAAASGSARTGNPSPGHAVPPAMQYLYGSGEAAAGSRQAYGALGRYISDYRYRKPDSLRQLVLSDGSTLAEPYFEPCRGKPPAIVLDIDETALLNVGYEADEAARGLGFDDARWQRWEANGGGGVVAVPGARDALAQARKAGIAVIFNSNRTAANAAATEAALNATGLGPAKHGQTLWLKGDNGGGSAKDDRRWAIASGYCVIALVGDQLGDFSDLFNDPALTPATRRAAADGPKLAELWGNGWFMLPNPVYGSALKGGADDVFSAEKRWTDPGTAKIPAKE